MNIVHQKVAIYNNKIKESAELIFESYSDSSENVGLTLVLAELGRYQFQDSDFYKALFTTVNKQMDYIRQWSESLKG